jgi:tetratricopeptide (TPR) repeat protein
MMEENNGGGSSILLSETSFPFPPTTTTPVSSLVFLVEAIYDQCPKFDGSIQIKDVIDLIKSDPNSSVASALGLPSSEGIERLFPKQPNSYVDVNETKNDNRKNTNNTTTTTTTTNTNTTTITKDDLFALFHSTRALTSPSTIESTRSALISSSPSLSSLLPNGVSETVVSEEEDGSAEAARKVAQVRGVPFPKLPPENMLLPPKAPKNPAPRSPKRHKFTIGVEGGNTRADARGRYAEVLRVDPNNTDALEHIGFFYVNNNQPTKALQALNRARALGCDNLRLWRSTGRAHYLKWRLKWSTLESPIDSTEIPMKRILLEMPDDEHLQAAHLAYERCTKFHLFVPDSKFWHELAEIYFHFKAYEGALGVVRHITRDDPKYIHMNEVIAMCGVMYFRLKQYDRAIECWTKVLHDPPYTFKERNILFILGRLHMLSNNVEKSKSSFEEVYDFVRKRNLQVSEEQYSRVNSARDYMQDPDTWLDECRHYMDKGYYEMAYDALNIAYKYSVDMDSKLGVPNYSRENLKKIWVGISRTWAFRGEPSKALEAMIEAQAVRPYDFYVRDSLIQMDPNPDQWTDIFHMESKHALMLTRLVRGHLERQRLRRERRIMGNAATKMARIFRGVRWRVRLKGLYLTLVDRRRNVRAKRNRALLKLQSIGRMSKARNNYIVSITHYWDLKPVLLLAIHRMFDLLYHSYIRFFYFLTFLIFSAFRFNITRTQKLQH